MKFGVLAIVAVKVGVWLKIYNGQPPLGEEPKRGKGGGVFVRNCTDILLREAPITSGTAQDHCPYVRPSVRDFGDFCEGYKRVTRGHIRLDNFSEICPRFILVTLTNRD